jgi:glycosyltransferase involved in cell wall biosynthesis
MEGPTPTHPRVAMIQDGARLNYLVPLAIQRAGMLERAFVDWFVRQGSAQQKISELIGKVKPRVGRKMAERVCPELDERKIVDSPLLGLYIHARTPSFSRSEDSFIWASRKMAKWIIRQGFGEANVLHGFVRNAAPEAYIAAREKGLQTSGDQMIAPLEIEFAEMQKQLASWPGWNDSESIQQHPEYLHREQQTWQCVDGITCASDYVRDGLVSVGVPTEKITVIPYPWLDAGPTAPPRQRKSGLLTVGFVGAVGLRKGAPYFLEIARRFDPNRVKFAMVGKVLLDKQKLLAAQGNVEIVGALPRSQIEGWLRKFDLFLFPTTCEGSAVAVMEAMGRELPVLTTPNSGTVARDGIEGFIHRFDDIDGFEQSIRRLDDDRDLLLKMGQAARTRVLSFGVEFYQSTIADFFRRLTATNGAAGR